jgi:hypothetical protein
MGTIHPVERYYKPDVSPAKNIHFKIAPRAGFKSDTEKTRQSTITILFKNPIDCQEMELTCGLS